MSRMLPQPMRSTLLAGPSCNRSFRNLWEDISQICLHLALMFILLNEYQLTVYM
jgi:hypothetical protein